MCCREPVPRGAPIWSAALFFFQHEMMQSGKWRPPAGSHDRWTVAVKTTNLTLKTLTVTQNKFVQDLLQTQET